MANSKQIKRWKQQSGLDNMQLRYLIEHVDRIVAEETGKHVKKNLLFMLSIPLNVLVSSYWTEEEAKEKSPAFVDEIIELYEAVENGNVSDKELFDLLEDMAGIKLEEIENKMKG